MAKQIQKSRRIFKSVFFAMLLHFFCPTSLPAQTSIDLSDYQIEEIEDYQTENTQYKKTYQTPTITKIKEARIPTSNTIQKYRDESRFQYNINQEPEVKEDSNWFSDIIIWFFGFIFKILAFPPSRWIIIIVVAIFVIRAIAKYTQVDFLPMLKKRKLEEGNGEDYTNLDENIDHNFDKLLNSALADKNYRLAVRLLFLKNLKALSTKGFISWDKNKTNSNYLYEIKEAELKNSFAQNSRIFDYIWYGEFDIDEAVFITIQQQYNQSYKDIVSHAI